MDVDDLSEARRDPPAPQRTASRKEKLKRLVFGSHETIAGTVYGTIVVMAAVAAGSVAGGDVWRLAVIVVVTVLVLWVAHVYSHGIGESIHRGRRLDRAELVTVARRELSIPLAAVAPTAALLLGALSVVRTSTAVWAALAVGVVTLAFEGVRYSQLEHVGRVGTVVAVGINVALGLAIVLLKALLSH